MIDETKPEGRAAHCAEAGLDGCQDDDVADVETIDDEPLARDPGATREPRTTPEEWLGLLSSLSDEQLTRYGDIARDQQTLEWNNALMQALALAGALALLAAGVAEVLAGWSWQLIVLTVAAAAICGNFPWQKHRMRRLWGRHLRAVKAEQARRAAASGAPASDSG